MNKTIADQYKLVTEGKLNQSQFMRNARLNFPQFITNITSFNDTVKILKNKNIISESKQEEHYDCDPQQYDLGMRYELEKGTDKDKASNIVHKNLKDNRSYYTDLHLSGYKEESMKKDRKKRTDLPIEVKKDNYVDKSNETKKVKMDKLTEDELKIMISNIITESLDNNSEPISINDLTYEKALDLAGGGKFQIQTKDAGVNSVIIDKKDFNRWKENILNQIDGNETLSYYSKYGFKFTDQSLFNAGNKAVSSFYNSSKYKGD